MRRAALPGLLALPLCLAALAPAGAVAQARPPAAESTFLDAEARSLLEGARASRERLDSAIAGYTTVVTERISAGFRAFWRERLLFRREVAMRLNWRRAEPSSVEVLGARYVTPVASTEVEVPDERELAESAGEMLFQPGRDRLLVGLEDGDALRHPLAEGAHADYRYETGDTMRIGLPGGRTVQLIELRVHPRRDDFDLIAGSFWLDADSHSVVRAVYRPARPFELVRDLARLDDDEDEEEAEREGDGARAETNERDGEDARAGDEDDDDGVGWIPGFLRPIRAEVRQIVVEYGLWEMRWWLPRVAMLELRGSAGDALGMPVRYERSYAAYDVEPVRAPGDSAFVAASESMPDPCSEHTEDDASGTFVAADSVPPPMFDELPEGTRWGCRCPEDSPCRPYVVGPMAEPDSLRTSPLLPGSVYAEGDALFTEAQLDEFARIAESLPRSEDRWARPRLDLTWGLGGSGLLRYNRVEGLSVGARVEADAGRARADLTVRLGTADLEPNGEIGLESAYYVPGVRLAAYRRLVEANHGRGALGLGNSFFAAVFGRDDGDYHRSAGIELTSASGGLPRAVDGRLFVEHHSAARKETDGSLRRLFDGAHRFRTNFAAASADQVGMELNLQFDRGLAAHGFRWGMRTEMLGSAGTFDFGRAALDTWVTVPLPAGLVGAIDAEAGASIGDVPPQSLWRLGGPATLRGYDGSAAVGATFWRVRTEIATAVPGARIGIFGDAAWAGPRADWGTGRPLRGVGIGASVLDGIIRLDVGRALDPPHGWRVAMYLDALL